MNLQSLQRMNELLREFIGPQIEEIVSAYTSDSSNSLYFVSIPDVDTLDLGIHEMASLVARTSNVYGRVARLAGMARAQYKLIEGSYKKVYKANRVGKNEAEREANALEAAESEYTALITAEAIVNLAESMELAARIASESARKLIDKIQSMQVASAREEKGYFSEKDFNTY
jgi:hypothetical protein